MSRAERTGTRSIGMGLWGWVALALCGSVAPANAVSLASLLAGGSIVSGDVELSSFEAKVSGKGLSSDFALYDVQSDSGGGIIVTLAYGTDPGKNGKLKILYHADSMGAEDLAGAFLDVDAESGVDLRSKVKMKGAGALVARNALGKDFDEVAFKKLFEELDVRLSISAKDGLGMVTAGLGTAGTQVPEPNTAALIALGLLGIGWVGGSRRRSSS